MCMQIFTGKIGVPAGKRKVEFAESKGAGHPDSVCDAVCEECGRALADYYMKNFNRVLHYNIDKGLLVAGSARPGFGGGRIDSPVRLTIAGRATDRVGGKRLPVRKLVKDTALKFLKRFSLAKFRVIVDIKSAASNLEVVSESEKAIANDTSFGASHYPMSRTESLVLEVQEYLSSQQFRKLFPYAGLDTKVMGVRTGDNTELTVAIAFIGKHVRDMDDYIVKKDRIAIHLIERFRVRVDINMLDDTEGDAGSVYLTVSGLSAEMGDDGQVGRGNRYNGLITPGRPMSVEATAGKNCRHPGRSYQVAAHLIAKELVQRHDAGCAEVQLVTDIGAPLDMPKAVYVRSSRVLSSKKVESAVKRCVKRALKM